MPAMPRAVAVAAEVDKATTERVKPLLATLDDVRKEVAKIVDDLEPGPENRPNCRCTFSGGRASRRNAEWCGPAAQNHRVCVQHHRVCVHPVLSSRLERRKENQRLDDSRRLAALSEAAHAVADHRFGYTIHGVTLSGNNNNGSLDRVSRIDTWMRWEAPPEGVLEEFVVGCLAGFAAERRLAPDQSEAAMMRANGDLRNAAELLRLMGEMDRGGPDNAIPGRWIERASVFVDGNWAAISVVAAALIRLEKLFPEEVEYLMCIADGKPGAVEDLRMWCTYQFQGQSEEAEARYRALLLSAGVDAVSDPTKGADENSDHPRPGSRSD